MAVPAGCKYTPSEEVLVGNVLRKKVRGEPLDRAAADCIREADVYGDHPARLTALFPPTNQVPPEWFFLSWCKVKGTRSARRGGRDDDHRCQEARARRGNGFKRGRKERTVRDAGGVEIGLWRSTQAVKDVIQIDASGRAVVIGYHQNFEFRDSKKQKSDWLMEEYGILPSSGGAEEAACRDDKELVICKIYKTPAARRAEAKLSVAPTAVPPRVSSLQPCCPSQTAPLHHRRPPLEPQPSPPPPQPWSALPPLLPASWPDLSLPQLPPTSWPDPSLPLLPPTSWPEQRLQPLPPRPEFATPWWPPQRDPMVPRLISAELEVPRHDGMMAAGVRSPSYRLDREWTDALRGAVVYPELYEVVAPFTSSPFSKQQALGPHTNLHHLVDHVATNVGGDQMETSSLISQCTATDISDHHTYDGNVLLPQSDRQQQQQQQQQQTESVASATGHAEGSTTSDDQSAAAGLEYEAEDLRASLQSVPTEQPPASSDHAHNPDEFFDIIDDGFMFAEIPTIDVDDYLMSDDFNFLDI